MQKALSTITSEIVLTIITLALLIPLTTYFDSIININVNREHNNIILLSCITYRYINETLIILFNNCKEDFQVQSIIGPNVNIKILYYDTNANTLKETKSIYAKKIHLLLIDKPVTKIVLNTSTGIIVLEK